MVEEQRFFYRNRYLYSQLIIGLVWLVLALSASFFGDWKSGQTAFFYLMSIAYWVLYISHKRSGHVLLKPDGELRIMSLFSKPIQLKEVVTAKLSFGVLLLQAPNREMRIHSSALPSAEFERLLQAVSQWVAIDVPNRQAVS